MYVTGKVKAFLTYKIKPNTTDLVISVKQRTSGYKKLGKMV